jgi:uncharacterized membrane protein
MGALAYLIPPLSGLIAYLTAADARTRFHGLQSIVLGAVWPLLIYVGAIISPLLTRAFFVAGALVWLALLSSTVLGLDVEIPGFGKRLRRIVSFESSG